MNFTVDEDKDGYENEEEEYVEHCPLHLEVSLIQVISELLPGRIAHLINLPLHLFNVEIWVLIDCFIFVLESVSVAVGDEDDLLIGGLWEDIEVRLQPLDAGLGVVSFGRWDFGLD